ncbi:MAG: ATP-dependent helicase [Acidimicrobiales bacterium]
MATLPIDEAGLGADALSPAQREAVWVDAPVVCVRAGPGAGKTGVLTMRVARRSGERSADPKRVQVLTFSRRAAQELHQRLAALGAEQVAAGTLHRLALRILRDWRMHTHRPAPRLVGDRAGFLAKIGNPALAAKRDLYRLDAEIGWAKSQMITPERYREHPSRGTALGTTSIEWVAQRYEEYQRALEVRGLSDLDDLVLEAAAALSSDAGFAEANRWRFRHLFIDEGQDLNPAQFNLVVRLGGEHPDLFVVGDPDQAIYGWNGSDPALLLELKSHFRQSVVIELSENHRCSEPICLLAAAALGSNGTSTGNGRRGPVPDVTCLGDDQGEREFVAAKIITAARSGVPFSDIAVLARTNAQLAGLSETLRGARIPASVAGGASGPASDVLTRGASLQLGGADPVAQGEESVALSTFHRAKGLQWGQVFVTGLREGVIPHESARGQAAIDEERRLLYVAMTRARHELHLSWATRHARGPEGAPCRWLSSIQSAARALADDADPGPQSHDGAANLAAVRRQLSKGHGGTPRGGARQDP